MKLKINKACDLSSISVLPPHARRSSVMPPGTDASGLGKSHSMPPRSQSQQSFSQGMSFSQGLSFSQLSQNSFEENEQRFGSQERDNTSKRISSLAPMVSSAREDSQLQPSRTSNNALHRWKAASVPDNRCQVSDEIDQRIRQMESSLNRLGIILDSVQGDVMQVHRAVKEVSLETEGIRHKIFGLDNSMQLVVKGEERMKAFLDGSLKSIHDQISKGSDNDKLNEVATTLSVLPTQIETGLQKLQHELCSLFTKETEVIANGIKSIKNNIPGPIQSPETKSYISPRRRQKSWVAMTKIDDGPSQPSLDNVGKFSSVRTVAEFSKALKPKTTDSNRQSVPKKEHIPIPPQDQDFRIIISDEESDGGVSCLLVGKETGMASILIEEANEETLRILKKARKRRRKHNCCPIVV